MIDKVQWGLRYGGEAYLTPADLPTYIAAMLTEHLNTHPTIDWCIVSEDTMADEPGYYMLETHHTTGQHELWFDGPGDRWHLIEVFTLDGTYPAEPAPFERNLPNH